MDSFVSFGNVARQRLGMQCQYARHYLTDPTVNQGVRWEGELDNYHGLTIHQDDVDTFVTRVQQLRRERGEIR